MNIRQAFTAAVVALVVFFGVYYGVRYLRHLAAQSSTTATEQRVSEALKSATIDVSDYGGTTVTLANGSATFDTGPAGSASKGAVVLSDKHATIFKGSDADVFAVVGVNGGGTGTFATLIWFSYDGASGKLTEQQALPLGDRIIVDSVDVNQTQPVSYDVLVQVKERRLGEAMAAVPTQPEVLHFTRDQNGLSLHDVTFGTIENPKIILTSPLPGATVPHTFEIKGAVHGNWYFEASFPVAIEDAAGHVIAQLPAQAQGDWMTTDLVPFTASITLPDNASGTYAVVLKKDNPSGDPAKDESYQFPISVQ